MMIHGIKRGSRPRVAFLSFVVASQRRVVETRDEWQHGPH